MKNNRSMKRRGFTLVELLIVIVVIGVLSAMMMLSSTEAVSSAKASNVVSNLRNLKTAALAWYADHLDEAEGMETASTNLLSTKKTEIHKYLNNEHSTELNTYNFTGKGAGTWYVYVNVSDTNVIGKLKGRQSSVGLRKLTNTADGQAASADIGSETSAINVGMFIR